MSTEENVPKPLVAILFGSKNDVDKARESEMSAIFDACGIPYCSKAISAHRNADELAGYCRTVSQSGAQVFIGVAGMAAALPGAIAGICRLKVVIGVGLTSSSLAGLDALLSITRMPPGVPVLFAGLDRAGFENAAIAAAQILGISLPSIRNGLSAYMVANNKSVLDVDIRPSPKP